MALLSVVLFSMTTTAALAQVLGTSTPTVYQISIVVKFRNAATNVFETALNETNSDIAAVSQNSIVATIASLPITPGDYNAAQAILSCTFRMKGSVVCPAAFCGVDTTYHTAQNADKISTNVADLADNDYILTPPACTDDPSPGKRTDTSTSVQFTSRGQVNFIFDLADKLELIGPVASPSFRIGGISLGITTGAGP
ncbi:MAG: hypothetical protein HYV05_02880 [Deltaproteobacteria bacterium]|nr:hypothetical protein [Deltaproteobacteria bacterium]